MNELVLHSRVADIGVITINNPPVNALSPGVPEGILAGIEQFENDPSVKAIIIIGGGRTFIAGADIKEFGKITASGNKERGPGLNPVLERIETSTKPVIAAIHGTALGGGLETAMACHYRVAVASAQVGQPEVKLGIIPGAGGTQRLPRLIGPSKAKDLIYTGRFVEADEALEIGLVDAVVPADKVYDTAVAMAAKFAKGPARALGAAKAAIDGGMDADLATGLRLESHLFASLFATDDRAIGMKSFLENGPGKAEFTGVPK